MDLYLGILIGFFGEFILNRIFERVNHNAGAECGYDCMKCTAHCTGYHCGFMRQEMAESDEQGGTENEISDLSPAPSDRSAL